LASSISTPARALTRTAVKPAGKGGLREEDGLSSSLGQGGCAAAVDERAEAELCGETTRDGQTEGAGWSGEVVGEPSTQCDSDDSAEQEGGEQEAVEEGDVLIDLS
jgi:hypothetical protein